MASSLPAHLWPSRLTPVGGHQAVTGQKGTSRPGGTNKVTCRKVKVGGLRVGGIWRKQKGVAAGSHLEQSMGTGSGGVRAHALCYSPPPGQSLPLPGTAAPHILDRQAKLGKTGVLTGSHQKSHGTIMLWREAVRWGDSRSSPWSQKCHFLGLYPQINGM